MKEENQEKKIMDLLDGIPLQSNDTKLRNEARQLESVIEDLKSLRATTTELPADEQMEKFIESIKTKSVHSNKDGSFVKKTMIFTVAIAATLLLLFLLFKPKEISVQYANMENNPDRMSMIHDLSKQQLSNEELNVLSNLLTTETNPNIRVLIIDILDQQRHKPTIQFAENILSFDTPTEQLAMLYHISKNPKTENIKLLDEFVRTQNLESFIRSETENILENLKN